MASNQCFQCDRFFGSLTSLTQHMEDSRCGPGAKAIRCAVSSMDTRGLFTNKMIGSSMSDNDEEDQYLYPAGSVTATEESWNGSVYECGLCHRGYNKLQFLNKHLLEYTHREQVYRCSYCSRTFHKPSSLVAHIESRSCGTPVTLQQQMRYLLNGLSQLENDATQQDFEHLGRNQSFRVAAEIVREVAFSHNLYEVLRESNKTLFFNSNEADIRFEVYYTTGTVRVTLSHPKLGPNSLHRTDVFNPSECFSNPDRVRAQLTTVFCNPRYHSNKGYRRTEDSVRTCAQCGCDEPRDHYSANQWRKGSGMSRCVDCA